MKTTRRTWLKSAAVAAGGALLTGRRALAAPVAKIADIKVISHLSDLFHGWPTVARRRNGDLLLVCSGGREAHVCPFGRVDLMISRDGGESWSWPRVVMDGPIDDRDAGVLETAQGSILITTFTSLAYEPQLTRAEKIEPGQPGAWPEERLARWQAAHDRATAEGRQAALSVWMIRSTDGGVTFSGRYFCEVNSPHGPIQLSDGRLLYAGKELWHGENRIGVCQSSDDGQTWQLARHHPDPRRRQPSRSTMNCTRSMRRGRLIVQIRNHNKANERETLQSRIGRRGHGHGPCRTRSASGACLRICCGFKTAGC
jgi:sialidase-1